MNKLQMVSGGNEVSEKRMSLPQQSFSRDWLRDFLDDLTQSIDVRSNSKKTYRSAIKRFFDYLDITQSKQVTRAEILSFRDFLKDTGKQSTTVRNYLAALRVFFNWLAVRDLYPNITAGIKTEKPSKTFKKTALSPEESRKFFSSIQGNSTQEKRNKAMISLMLICGLRTIEVSRANVGSLTRRNGILILQVRGKGRDDESDFVRVPELVKRLIDTYLVTRAAVKDSDPLFASMSNENKGGRLSTKSISNIAKRALVSAGFIGSKFTAHSLRHTAATNAILAGAKLEEVSQMLRHRSLEMTMIYNHTLNALENPSERLVAAAMEEKPRKQQSRKK